MTKLFAPHASRYKKKVEMSSRYLIRRGRVVSSIVMMAMVLAFTAASTFAPAAAANAAASTNTAVGNEAGSQKIGREEGYSCPHSKEAKYGGEAGDIYVVYQFCVDLAAKEVAVFAEEMQYWWTGAWYYNEHDGDRVILAMWGTIEDGTGNTWAFHSVGNHLGRAGAEGASWKGSTLACGPGIKYTFKLNFDMTGPRYTGTDGHHLSKIDTREDTIEVYVKCEV